MSTRLRSIASAYRSLVACCLFVLALNLALAADAAEALKINNSTCTVQFGVKDDRFYAVSFVQWRLSPRFRQLYAGFRGTEGDAVREQAVEKKLQEQLLRSLTQALALDLPISAWAQGDAALAAHAKLPGKAPSETLSWAEALTRFPPRDVGSSLDQMSLTMVGDPSAVTINQLFDHALINDTPLRKFTTRSFDKTEAAQNRLQKEGHLRFRLLDPVSDQDIATAALTFRQRGRTVSSAYEVAPADLARLLAPLQGQLWIRREIAVRVGDYYRQRGAAVNEAHHLVEKVSAANALLVPTKPDQAPEVPVDVIGGLWAANLQDNDDLLRVEFADGYARRTGRRIHVIEPAPLEEIALGPLETPGAPDAPETKDQWRSTAGKLFYATLDGERWELFRRKRILETFAANPAANEGFKLARLSGTGSESSILRKLFLLDEELGHRTGAISQLGFGAKQEGTTLWIRKLPATETTEEVGAPDTQAAKAAVGEAAGPEEASVPEEQNLLSPDEAGEADDTPRVARSTGGKAVVKKTRDHLQSAGLSVTQHPGRGLEAAGTYARKFGDKTKAFSFTVGNWDESFGSAKFEKDYLLFEQIGRRWLVDVEPYSNFEPDEPTVGGTTDERRTGTKLYSEIDLLRARSGHWLRLTLDAAREKVTAAPAAGAPELERNDTSGNLGVIWYWRHPTRLASPDITVGANYKAVRSSLQSFDIATVNFRYHQNVADFMQVEISGAGMKASRDTPFTDLPKLGGTSSVRGYRDAALAAPEVGYLQSEYWLPLRALERLYPKFGPMIRRQYAAVFADVGWARETAQSRVIAGAGVGLRLNLAGNYAIKLDVARGLRSEGDVRARTSFHFALNAAFPF